MKKKGGGGRGKKKIDPEVQKQQFEEWKLSDEYNKWLKVCDLKENLKKEYAHDITETTEDLTGNWQEFENELFEFMKVMKVKTKFKELKHEHIRSFFFAKEDKDNFNFDGILAGVTKTHSDPAFHLRHKFIDIWKGLDELGEFEPTTYMAARKKMAKDLSDLLKMMIPHIRNCHKEIYEEKLGIVLRPFANILKTNMRFSAFEANYDSPEAREIVSFKYNTLIEEFCKDTQECLRILHLVEKDPEKRVVAAPDIHRVFNKLGCEGWEKIKIEVFYLSKLRTALFTMRNHMIKSFVKGIDHWKIPLSSNTQFLDDIKVSLIKKKKN